MSDIAIFGDRGSGKTTLAMFLCRYFQEIYPNLEIYTNANLPAQPNLFTIADLTDIPMDRNAPRILIVDEAMHSIDSRSSSSKHNRLFSAWFAYLRRFRFIHTFVITHRPNMIDVRFRDQLDFIIFARDDVEYFSYLFIEITTEYQKPFYLKKEKDLFDYANFNTFDFPNVLTTKKLQLHPLFMHI